MFLLDTDAPQNQKRQSYYDAISTCKDPSLPLSLSLHTEGRRYNPKKISKKRSTSSTLHLCTVATGRLTASPSASHGNGRHPHHRTIADSYLISIGVRPVVELSFTPSPLANDTCHHFYYNGCEQVPTDLNLYYQYVFNFTSTLVDFFGPEEVATWYFEVRCATSHTPHTHARTRGTDDLLPPCPMCHAPRRHRTIIPMSQRHVLRPQHPRRPLYHCPPLITPYAS